MKTALFLVAITCSVCNAADRLAVVLPSDDERQVQDLLDRMSSAVDDENLRAYLSCFTKETASRNKKEASLLFMTHDMSLEVDKFAITDATEDFVEFTTKYTVYEDASPSRVVSTIRAKRDADRLLISKEQILSKQAAARTSTAAVQVERIGAAGRNAANPCANGQCAVPPPKAKNNPGPEVLESISMFNDADGNPDPNGIMWIDPKKLLARFPDKYGVPPCMRKRLAEEAGLK